MDKANESARNTPETSIFPLTPQKGLASRYDKTPTTPPPSPTQAAPRTYTTIDPHGDLYLVVGEDRVVFLVCSRTIARASPVFNRMLYGIPRFAEAKPEDGRPWVVTLEDDCAEAMRDVLRMLHGQARQVGVERRQSQAIYSMLVITDKYDCTDAVAQIVRPWLPDLGELRWATSGERACRAIGIAWQLGHRKAFDVALLRLIKHAHLSSDDDSLVVMSDKGSPLPLATFPLIPQDLDSLIFSARSSGIEESWKKVQDITQCKFRVEKCNHICFSYTLKSLGFEFGAPFERWPDSGRSLYSLTTTVHNRCHYGGASINMDTGHIDCDPRMRLTKLCTSIMDRGLASFATDEMLQPYWDKLHEGAARTLDLVSHTPDGT